MKRYVVLWQEEAAADLQELPPKTATAMVKKVESYLAQNPCGLGQALTGRFAGLHRYRMGDYRIIYEIAEREIRIYVVRVGHRKEIYDA